MLGVYICFAVVVLLLIAIIAKVSGGGDHEEIASLRRELSGLEGVVATKLDTTNGQMNDVRSSVTQFQQHVHELLDKKLSQLSTAQQGVLDGFRADINGRLVGLATTMTDQLSKTGGELRSTLNERLLAIQKDNSDKLEVMRQTVDEKLHETLEKRLGEKFTQVQTLLGDVQQGLGEMKSLATGVGDLKRVLSNVKSRGTWGEVQLGALLEQVLTSDQYAKNVMTKPGSRDVVEFAIKLPGQDRDSPVWLPVDAKFPVEDYQRLTDAQDRADVEQVEAAGKALEQRIKQEAKTIRDKYVSPPHTTDFGILFLPTEGLYAEVLRRPGLVDSIQHDHRVSIAGPSTFAALLNSLQMGFKTLAIEKRSSEIWVTLGQIKTEFSKFGDVIEATKRKLHQASEQFEVVDTRTRAINRRLKSVDALPVMDGSLMGVDSLELAE